jgi:hypothetical protein
MSERTDAHYDPEKGTIKDANGVVRDVHFSLPDDVQKELDAKLGDLHAFCVEHAIPYRAAYVVAHAKKNMDVRLRGIHLGARTPAPFVRACSVFERTLRGESVLDEAMGEVLAALASGKQD